MMTAPEFEYGIDDFVAISTVLTGYSRAELFGTGCADEYWHQFRRVVPDHILIEFFNGAAKLERLQETDPQAVALEIRSRYLSSEKLGPLARTLIQLWYLGQWVPLPPSWRSRFGASRFDVARVISVLAYKEGLVWDAIGAHPMGAKQQGFGSWAEAPPKGGV
ncbi:hypothetical protein EI545_19195 [Tabrizicola piscis]|uniref:Uncharacterized protein n=1 Tax=Tabrizicola piscis TaxID=2494374 RepID=A0A3S8UB23_9RHOB|nr:hypothetical protein [Tabrizicola piscis]AZL60759.1 hypothetical protein EI545_19195 [Tabrizicola piscis]